MPSKPRGDVMVDLETYGRSAGCPVLSIGACQFSAEGVGPGYYCVVSLKTCHEAGLKDDAETVAWWNKQSEAARKVLDEALAHDAMHLKNACEAFNEWLANTLGLSKSVVKLWGNGAGFDQPILEHAYDAVGVQPHWEFWNHRCYRTLKALSDPAIKVERGGTHHNALDDAKTQAEHASRILRAAGRF